MQPNRGPAETAAGPLFILTQSDKNSTLYLAKSAAIEAA